MYLFTHLLTYLLTYLVTNKQNHTGEIVSIPNQSSISYLEVEAEGVFTT